MTKKPWLSHYDFDVPQHINYPNLTLHELFLKRSEQFQNNVCLNYLKQKYTYEETRELVLTLASTFIGMNIEIGSRVGIILPNTPEFVICYYAVLTAGAVAVPLNPVYTESELNAQIQKTQISTVIGTSKRSELLRQLKRKNQFKYLILCDENDPIKLSIVRNKLDKKIIFQQNNEINLRDLFRDRETVSQLPEVKSDWPAVFQFTGGTTGVPKAAVALHKNLVANVFQFRNWLNSLKDGEEQFLSVIPLSHVYGMVIGLNVGISMGATLNLIPDPRDTRAILNTIQREGISFYPGVPAMYYAINQYPEVKNGSYDLKTIKACISGSAPLRPEIRKEFEHLTGGKLVEGYGLSEAPTATHCNPIRGENRNGSIGLPLPDVDCKIIPNMKNANGGGELYITGPQVMSHYHENEEESLLAISNGWLKTGDFARMDADGYFYILGRKKDLIKVGGLQVWPREVEEVISRFPQVKEVVVAGIPELARGESVKAWIVLKDDQKISTQQIKTRCESEIAHFKVPSEIEFVTEIPKTPVGKVNRQSLVLNNQIKKSGVD